jgi:hypothetical protein
MMFGYRFKNVFFSVVVRKTMTRTFEEPKNLRSGYEEVEDLWYKKQ